MTLAVTSPQVKNTWTVNNESQDKVRGVLLLLLSLKLTDTDLKKEDVDVHLNQ